MQKFFVLTIENYQSLIPKHVTKFISLKQLYTDWNWFLLIAKFIIKLSI